MKEIQKWYPETLQTMKSQMLREYLQYEILKIIFSSKFGHKYTFLGGTCLRIAYNTQRFSEDLDFDNLGLEQAEFEATAAIVKQQLELLGYEVYLKFAYKGAYHCNIRFPALLYQYGLSGHKEARLLIKLDTEKQHFDYEREMYDLNKFGVRADIRITPLSLLASQKIAAVLGRKRPKGRDFYDLRFILAQTRPNYAYLQQRFGVSTPEGLRELVRNRIATFDFTLLAKDVAPFLLRREDITGVREFAGYWEGVVL